MPRIITITSGKGGVGKTSVSLNLSLALAAEGFKVCLFDADLGLANVNILTGIYPNKDLASVISGQFSIKDVIIPDYLGIDIMPGSSGIAKIADLTQTQTGTLIAAFLELEEYDFFIFDTSAGISAQVLSFCMASHEMILVATCEPTSLTDAYSMLKVLSKHGYANPIRVVINQVRSGPAAKKAYLRLKQTAGRFLSVPLLPLGVMAADKNVRAAVISQTPFYHMFPDTVASRCIQSMADRLLRRENCMPGMPIELFWEKALRFLDTYSTVEKETPLPEKTVSEKKQDLPTPDLKEIRYQLASLDAKVTALANDIIVIKQLLKSDKGKKQDGEPEGLEKKKESSSAGLPEIKPVSLDFEAWYGRQKKS